MTPQLFGLSYVYEYALLPSWTLALYFSNWLIIGTTAAAINGHIFVGALACHISYVEIDIALGFSFLIGGMLVTPPGGDFGHNCPGLVSRVDDLTGFTLGDLSAAQNCISHISGLRVATKSSPNYASLATPFNLRMNPQPGLIVSPTTVSQIQSVVACAADAGVSVSPRSGGHSYAAYGLAGDVVIDMANLRSITLNADKKARVETGNRLGDVASQIYTLGQRALPHGSCPYVGVGGHTLYGGFGYFSRIGGLLADTVVEAEVVLANGSLVTASANSNTDLFYAIRGGGPSFGLVTAWTYQTLSAPPVTVSYRISFSSGLDASEATAAYITWEAFAAEGQPDELAMAAVFGATSPGLVSLEFSGTYYGPESRAATLLAPLMAKMPKGATLTTKSLDWIEGLEAFAGGDGTLNTATPDTHDNFFAKSIVTTDPLSTSSVSAFVEYIAMTGASSDTAWFVQVDLYGAGGVIDRFPSTESAFAHRNAFMVWQLYASKLASELTYPADGLAFVNDMVAALTPHPTGAYANYIDPTLGQGDWPVLYFGKNVARLKAIKTILDPKNVFRFPEGF